MADADPTKITVELERSLIEGLRVARERQDAGTTRAVEQRLGDLVLAAYPLASDPNIEWVIVQKAAVMQMAKRQRYYATMTSDGAWEGWTSFGALSRAARFPSREAADPLLRQVRRDDLPADYGHKTALAVPVPARKRRAP